MNSCTGGGLNEYLNSIAFLVDTAGIMIGYFQYFVYILINFFKD